MLKIFCTMLKIFCTKLKGYRRMSYLVLSQMESITAKTFKLFIRSRKEKKKEKCLKKKMIWAPRRLAVKHGPLRTAHRCQYRPLNHIIHHPVGCFKFKKFHFFPTFGFFLEVRMIFGHLEFPPSIEFSQLVNSLQSLS